MVWLWLYRPYRPYWLLRAYRVSSAVHNMSYLTWSSSTLHSQWFLFSASPSKSRPGSHWGKQRTRVWKNCDMICSWKWFIFQISMRQPYLPYCSLFFEFELLLRLRFVTYNESRSHTSVENCSRFCSISGDIFLFTRREIRVLEVCG